MRISQGELMLKLMTSGAVNQCDYIEKDKWIDIQMNSIDADFCNANDYFLKDEYAKHNASTKSINGCTFFYETCNIWNIWIHIDECVENLMDTNLILYNGTDKIIEISMTVNLLLAKLVGKDPIIDLHYVEIPVMLFDLLYPDKFPLYLTGQMTLTISLINTCNIHKITSIRYDYHKENTQKKNKIISKSAFKSSVLLNDKEGYYKLKDGRSMVKLMSGCKILFFEFLDTDDLNSIIIECDTFPIEYHVSDGEIIKYSIMDKTIYMLPLTPDISTIDDLTKLLSLSSRENKQFGIAYVRADNVRITFKFDNSDNIDRCARITAISKNEILRDNSRFLFRFYD
jgi:hypothetical protein